MYFEESTGVFDTTRSTIIYRSFTSVKKNKHDHFMATARCDRCTQQHSSKNHTALRTTAVVVGVSVKKKRQMKVRTCSRSGCYCLFGVLSSQYSTKNTAEVQVGRSKDQPGSCCSAFAHTSYYNRTGKTYREHAERQLVARPRNALITCVVCSLFVGRII